MPGLLPRTHKEACTIGPGLLPRKGWPERTVHSTQLCSLITTGHTDGLQAEREKPLGQGWALHDPCELLSFLPSSTRGWMYTAPQTFFFLVKNGKKAQGKPVLGKISVLRVPAPLLASAPHQGQHTPGKGQSVESLRDNTCLGLGSGSAAQNSRVSQRS